VTETRLAIQGIGVAGGFGLGKEALIDALRQGGRPNGTVSVPTAAGQRCLPAYRVDESPVRSYVSGGAWRRMNRYAKLALLGACQALEDAGWDRSMPAHDLGLVVASGYGASQSTFDFLDTMIEDGGRCPSPTQFSNSVHSSAVSHLGIVLQAGGPSLTVSQFEMSPVSAMLTAREWLREGRVQRVLFGAVDEICPVLSYCYDRFFGEAASGPMDPFAWNRQTAVLGEGVVFLCLTRAQGSAAYGTVDAVDWVHAGEVASDPGRGLVLGADGQICCAKAYCRLASEHPSPVAYSPVYGSLPGGQAFDLAAAALAARAGIGPQRVVAVKCDAYDNYGVIACEFQGTSR